MNSPSKHGSRSGKNISIQSLLEDTGAGENGFFRVEYRDGDAWLVVHPPGQGGKPVRLEDVHTRLKVLKVQGATEDQIRRVVEEASGEPVHLCPWPEGAAVNGDIQVSVSPDEMHAYMRLIPARYGGENPGTRDLQKKLNEKGVVFGLKEKEMERVFSSKIYNQDVLIANGKPPVAGEDGKVRYVFAPEEASFPLPEDDRGRVDYRELNKIRGVGAGEVVAELIDPTPGEPGTNVRGALLPARPGEPSHLPVGKNTVLSDDGKQLISAIDGHLVYENRTPHIEEVCRLEEVNFETGNIHFKGTVMADKMENGFTIDADGSIFLNDALENVNLKAGHDVILQSGIRSRGSANIQAGNDIKALFAENVYMSAHGSIYLMDALIHCKVTVDNDLVLTGNRGDIIGGQIICGGRIEAEKIGARVEAPTEIYLGIPPDVIKEIHRVQAEARETRDILEKIVLSLGPQAEQNKPPENDSPENLERREKLAKLQVLRDRYLEKQDRLQQELDQIINSYEPDPESRMVIRETIFPGVKVVMGRQYRIFRGRPLNGRYEIKYLRGEIVIT